MEAVSNERTAHEGGEESAAAVVYQHRLREHNLRVFLSLLLILCRCSMQYAVCSMVALLH